MLDHLEITVCDIQSSERFYRSALLPLGYTLQIVKESRGFGVSAQALDFWIKQGASATSLPHFAFQCRTRSLVDAAHAAAIEAGGKDNGAPSLLAHIHPSYYAGFALDPDGHNVEFVCHAAE